MSTVPPPKGSPPAQMTTEVRRPRTNRGLTVSFDDDDESDPTAHVSRLQYELAECVETKTITTTTTTKRSFPPLFIRHPRALEALDTKEYPLANGPTPPDLRKFSLDLNENDDEVAWSFPSYGSFGHAGHNVRFGPINEETMAHYGALEFALTFCTDKVCRGRRERQDHL